MDPRHRFGREAEERAAAYYRARGYRLVEKNFRAKRGELDLVLQRGGTLLFVEVKGRRRFWERHAWKTEWRKKEGSLRRAIAVYLQRRQHLEFDELRLEIVFVTQGRVEARFEGI
jgi:putative endonuclease